MSTKIKIALLAALAAVMFGLPSALGIGSGSVPVAQAEWPGDICAIQGPTTITLGSTVYYAVRIEDNDEGTFLVVDVDDLTGDADITSVWGDPINATNTVGAVDIEDPDTEDIEDFIDAGVIGPEVVDMNVCGPSVRDSIIEFMNENATFDWDDGALSGYNPPSVTIVNAIAAAIESAFDKGIGDEDDLTDLAQAACILAGGTPQLCELWIDAMLDSDDDDMVYDVIDDTAVVDITCKARGSFEISAFDSLEADNAFSITVHCTGSASSTTSTISANPSTVEIIPARSNTSHSLVMLSILDASGMNVAPGKDVDFSTDRCSIEEDGVDTNIERSIASILVLALNTASPATYSAWENSTAASTAIDSGIASSASRLVDLSESYDGSDLDLDGWPDQGRAAAVLGCNPVDAPGVTPGVANIRAVVEVADGTDVILTTTVTVIGPPAAIVVSASPSTLRCGEKATITATVKDAIGQNVSDHTRVELVTNLGGTIAGTGSTGSVGGFFGVAPISSGAADTFGGVATAFLITSEVTTGPYEVVATSGGTVVADSSSTTILGGIFSTPPVSAQATVSCSLPTAVPPAPTITAPRTGTGITPPNTGDAGLLSSDTGTSWTLFALGGVIALAVAGVATRKLARR